MHICTFSIICCMLELVFGLYIKNGDISHEIILPASARGESRKFRKGWLGHLPTCQLY